MTRLFTTLLLGATLTLSPMGAGVARANDDDLAKILAGLAVLGIIGVAIDKHNDRDDDRDRRKVRRKPHDKPALRRHQPRHHGHARTRAVLPRECLHQIDRRHQVRRVFGKRCLERHFHDTHRLPRQCLTQVHAYGRYRAGYGAHCLGQYGWTVARRNW